MAPMTSVTSCQSSGFHVAGQLCIDAEQHVFGDQPDCQLGERGRIFDGQTIGNTVG
jgi:hypothetical protein